MAGKLAKSLGSRRRDVRIVLNLFGCDLPNPRS